MDASPTPFTDDPTYLARFTLHRHFLSTYVGFRRLHTQCITRCDCTGCLGGGACVGSLGMLREERYRARVGWLEEWGVSKGMVLGFGKIGDRSSGAHLGDAGNNKEGGNERGDTVAKRRKLECGLADSGGGRQGEKRDESTELEKEGLNVEGGPLSSVLPNVKCNMQTPNLTANSNISPRESPCLSPPLPPPLPSRSLRQRTRTTTSTTKLLTNSTKPSKVTTAVPTSSTLSPPPERKRRTRAKHKSIDEQPNHSTTEQKLEQPYSPPNDWAYFCPHRCHYFHHPSHNSCPQTNAKSVGKSCPPHSPAPRPRPPPRNRKPLLTASGDFDLDGLVRLCNRATANPKAPAAGLGESKRWLDRNLKIYAQ